MNNEIRAVPRQAPPPLTASSMLSSPAPIPNSTAEDAAQSSDSLESPALAPTRSRQSVDQWTAANLLTQQLSGESAQPTRTSATDDDDTAFDATVATMASTQSINEVLRQLQQSQLQRGSRTASEQASLAHTVRDGVVVADDTFGPYVDTFALHTEVGVESHEQPQQQQQQLLQQQPGTTTSADIGESPAERLAAFTSPDYPRMTWQDVDTFGPYVSTFNLTSGANTAVRQERGDRGGGAGKNPLEASDKSLGNTCTNDAHQDSLTDGDRVVREPPSDFVPVLHFKPAEFVPRLVFKGNSSSSDESDSTYDERTDHASECTREDSSHNNNNNNNQNTNSDDDDRDGDDDPSLDKLVRVTGAPGSVADERPSLVTSSSSAPLYPMEPVEVLAARHNAAVTAPIREELTGAETAMPASPADDVDDWGDVVTSTAAPAPAAAATHDDDDEWGEPATAASPDPTWKPPAFTRSHHNEEDARISSHSTVEEQPFSDSKEASAGPGGDAAEDKGVVAADVGSDAAAATANSPTSSIRAGKHKARKNKSVSFSLNDNVVIPPPPPEHALSSDYFYPEPDFDGPEIAAADADGDGAEGRGMRRASIDDGDELPPVPMQNSPSSSALFGRMPAPRINDDDDDADVGEDGDGYHGQRGRKPRKIYFQSGFTSSATDSLISAPDVHNNNKNSSENTHSNGHAANVVTVPSAPKAQDGRPNDSDVVTFALPPMAGSGGQPSAADTTRQSLTSARDDSDASDNQLPLPGVVSLNLPAFAAPRGASSAAATTASTSSVMTATTTTTAGPSPTAGRRRAGSGAHAHQTQQRHHHGPDHQLSTDDEDEDGAGAGDVEDDDAITGLPEVWTQRSRKLRKSPGPHNNNNRKNGSDEEDDDDEEDEEDDDPFRSHGASDRLEGAGWHRGSTASTVAGNNASRTFPYVSAGLSQAGSHPHNLAAFSPTAASGSRNFLKPASSLGVAAVAMPSDRVAQLKRAVEQQVPQWARQFRQCEHDAAERGEGPYGTHTSSSARPSMASATSRSGEFDGSGSVSHATLEESEAVWRWPLFDLERDAAALDTRMLRQALSDSLGLFMARKLASRPERGAGADGVVVGGVVEVNEATTPSHPAMTSTESQESEGQLPLLPPPPLLVRRRRELNVQAVDAFLKDACALQTASPVSSTATQTEGDGDAKKTACAQRCLVTSPKRADTEANNERNNSVGAPHPLGCFSLSVQNSGTSPHAGVSRTAAGSASADTKSRTSVTAIYNVMKALSFTPMQTSTVAAAPPTTKGVEKPATSVATSATASAKRNGGGGGFWSWGGTAADVVVQAALEKQQEQHQILLEQSVAMEALSEVSRRGLSPAEAKVPSRADQPMTPLETGMTMLNDPLMVLPGYAAEVGHMTSPAAEASPSPADVRALGNKDGSDDRTALEDDNNALDAPLEMGAGSDQAATSLATDRTRDFSEIFGVAPSTPSLRSPAAANGPLVVVSPFAASVPADGEEGTSSASAQLHRPASEQVSMASLGTHSASAGGAAAGRRVRAVSIGAGTTPASHGMRGVHSGFSPPPMLSPLTNSLSGGGFMQNASFALHSSQSGGTAPSQLPSPARGGGGGGATTVAASTTPVARPSMSLSTLHTLYPLSRTTTAGGGGVGASVRRRSLDSTSATHFVPHAVAQSGVTSPMNGRRGSATGYYAGLPPTFGAPTGPTTSLSFSMNRPRAVSLQQQLHSIVLEQSVSASGVPEDVLTVLQLEEDRRSGRRGSAHETLADVLSGSQRPPQ